MLVINDNNYKDQLGDGKVVEFNGEPRYLSCPPREFEYSANPTMETFDSLNLKVIPRSEWDDRIAILQRTRAQLSDMIKDWLDSYDQDGTNYCWVNSIACAMTTIRESQGHARGIISSASIGAPFTGYRNVGGQIANAFKQARDVGATTIDKWPNNGINKKYMTDEVKADLANYKVVNPFIDLNTFDECATCALLGWPVPTGYNWWGHSTLILDLVRSPNNPKKWAFRERNSWGNSYGENGFFYLEEGKGTPDQAYAVTTLTLYQ